MKASLNNEVSIDREVIDSYLEQFSRFTYLLIDIDQLWKDTTARCQDFLDLFKALTKS